jgi:exosortase A-associated hydrolase 1
MRRLTSFDCAGAALGATLDEAAGATGLLLVTGGTQTRIGAHRGMARLTTAVAAAGFPAFRFDRRGVGDSEGDDPGFLGSAPDIAAAAAAFRRECPQVRRLLGFGLCDGATALALHHAAAGLDGLVLANPWIVEPSGDLPPPAAIRRRYAARLLDRAAWKRVLTGGIDYRAALRGLASAARPHSASPLATAMADALGAAPRLPIEIVLATGDATAIAFDTEWRSAGFAGVRARAEIRRIETSSHSFAASDEPDRLAEAVIAALARPAD